MHPWGMAFSLHTLTRAILYILGVDVLFIKLKLPYFYSMELLVCVPNLCTIWFMERTENQITAFIHRNLPFKSKFTLKLCKSENSFSIHTNGICALADSDDNPIIYA